MECNFGLDQDMCGMEFDDYSVKVIVAPEAFKCDECGRDFTAGVDQELTEATDCDGGDFVGRACMDCHHIAKGLITGARCHRGLWEGIEAEIEEEDTFTTACLAKVETASAKAYLVEQINKYRGLA